MQKLGHKEVVRLARPQGQGPGTEVLNLALLPLCCALLLLKRRERVVCIHLAVHTLLRITLSSARELSLHTLILKVARDVPRLDGAGFSEHGL